MRFGTWSVRRRFCISNRFFEIARREGYKADFRHITFGSILGEDRKLMKTRSGENVPLRELLEEACRRARENY